MASRKITFECEKCGTEVVVNAADEMDLRPIYCCGAAVTEVPAKQKKSAKTKKKAAKKSAARRVSGKKVKKVAKR